MHLKSLLHNLWRQRRRLSIRTNLMISMLLIGLLPASLVFLFTYSSYFGALSHSLETYSSELVNRSARDLDDYFADLQTLLTREQDFYTDQFIKLMQGRDFANARRYTFRIWEDFNNIVQTKTGLADIALTLDNGLRISTFGLYYCDPQQLESFTALTTAANPVDGVRLIGPENDFLGQPVMTMLHPYAPEGADSSVYISVDVKLATIAKIVDIQVGADASTWVIDPNGRIVYAADSRYIGRSVDDLQAFNYEMQWQNGLLGSEQAQWHIAQAYSPITGWTTATVAPTDSITGDLVRLQQVTGVILIIVAVGIFLLTVYLSNNVHQPIRQLQELSETAAAGDLTVKIAVNGEDEVARLGRSFNAMIARINALLEERMAEQHTLRRMELQSLDNQIKPHFIYNTLDMIIGELEANNNEKATMLIEALGQFFRLSLSHGREMVSIGSELGHVRNYLFIQKLRHGEEYDYQIEVDDPDILGSSIPRLLLQPLVENAIYHGLLKGQNRGEVTLRAAWEDPQSCDAIVFEVCDTGVGMEKDKAARINSVLAGNELVDEDHEFFGLRNVNLRTQLTYGPKYGLQVSSQPGGPTRFRLRIGITPVSSDPNGMGSASYASMHRS